MENYLYNFTEQTRKKSDNMMNYLLICFFLLGIIFSFNYHTWVLATITGVVSLSLYYTVKYFLSGSTAYQYVLSAVFGIFIVLFVYQMHGLNEMYFLAFVGSALLIVYQNWKLQIPIALIVILYYIFFNYAHIHGYVLYDTILQFNIQGFVMHIIIAALLFFICGIWTYYFKLTNENYIIKSFEMGAVEEANKQKQELVILANNLKLSNDKLYDVNKEMSIVFNTIEEVLFSKDIVNNRIIQISAGVKRLCGHNPIEFICDNNLWLKVISPEDRELLRGNGRRLKKGETITNQFRILHADKKIHWVEMKMIPTINQVGRLTRIDGICFDITKRMELEHQLYLEDELKQKAITAAAMTAQENERSFLGEELHDNINPILATAKLFLECAISGDENKQELIKDCRTYIVSAMNELRALSKSLVPPTLGEISLVEAINDLTNHISQVNNLKFDLKINTIKEHLFSEKLRLTIYRIIQEQITNIIKHAKANLVTVELIQKEQELDLVVKDNGIGFDTAKKRNGVGLQNINSRTSLFNGNLNIKSSPGMGCELFVVFNSFKEVTIPDLKIA